MLSKLVEPLKWRAVARESGDLLPWDRHTVGDRVSMKTSMGLLDKVFGFDS